MISIDNKLNNKKNKINRNKGGDIHRILRKNILEEKWLTIYVNEEQNLSYWKLVNKKEMVVIVPQNETIQSHINNYISIYFYNMNYYEILK